jgi:fumarylacetoacetase
MIDHTHDPAAKSWVSGACEHADFPLQNLPLGVFSTGSDDARIAAAIGDWVVDLNAIAAQFPAPLQSALGEKTLNALFALPTAARRDLRHHLFALLTEPEHKASVALHLHRQSDVQMQLPFRIGDYTDFYVGIHHATNIGKLFRPDSPLLPNYKHVPIGYHGRASSVRVSGAPVIRPQGQRQRLDADLPVFGSCERLDYELEMGVWLAGENELGKPVSIADAADGIGGLCLLNDWSARDIQAWEYQPLGPFLSKSFLTTISPWVVTSEALAPFRIAQPPRSSGDPVPLPYLWDEEDQETGAFAITLEAEISTAAMRAAGLPLHRLSSGALSNMYWTAAQMVTHHASNGCNLRPGDLLGTGTISGAQRVSYGSLMELSEGGTQAIELPSGEKRCFLEDGDELSLRAVAACDGFRSIGFGPCQGRVESSQ